MRIKSYSKTSLLGLAVLAWVLAASSAALALPAEGDAVSEGCHPNPCLNGGLCTDEPGDLYSCECTEGFTGSDCETPIDDSEPAERAQEPPWTACDDVVCEGCDVCVDGECLPPAPLECTSDDDCEGNSVCNIDECGGFCISIYAKEIAQCTMMGGEWDTCMDGCGPLTCEDYESPSDAVCDAACFEACVCPGHSPYWTDLGCVSDHWCREAVCDETGGHWNACASGSCPLCTDCVPACECPDGTVSIAQQGCVTPPPLAELCPATGGEEDCVAPDCPDGEACDTGCEVVCNCPEDQVWSSLNGCIDRPLGYNCQATGGFLDCASPGCDANDDTCTANAVCTCTCPDGLVYDDYEGCAEPPAPACGDVTCGPCEGCESETCVQQPGYQDCLDAASCTEAGGSWNSCEQGSCPTCTDCISACHYGDSSTTDDHTNGATSETDGGTSVTSRGCSGGDSGTTPWALLLSLALVALLPRRTAYVEPGPGPWNNLGRMNPTQGHASGSITGEAGLGNAPGSGSSRPRGMQASAPSPQG
jgi:hypothetical protein